MSYKNNSLFQSKHGFFRSSMASGLAGLFAGGSVIASAVEVGKEASTFQAALSTVTAAGVVALADWIVRRKRERQHEDKFQNEHARTRELIQNLLPRKRRTQSSRRETPGNIDRKEGKV